jgi:hypothetical protein
VATIAANSGTLSCDAALGTLSTSLFTAQGSATLAFDVDSTVIGVVPDAPLLEVSGTAALGASLLTIDSTQTYPHGSEIVLIAAGGISGVFSNASDGTVLQASGGQYFRIHINTTEVVAESLYVGATTPGFYDAASSTFSLRYSNSEGQADATFAYGVAGAGWTAVVGDWDGDGVQTVGLYDPTTSTFYLRNSNSTGNADISFAFGVPGAGWTPVVGDWTNCGIETVGLYDPETANWYLRNENSSGVADLSFGYGVPASGWTPLAGKWTTTRTATIGLYDTDGATWYLRNTNSTGAAEIAFAFGTPGSDVQALTGVWTAPLTLDGQTVDQLDLAALADEALRGIT